MKGDARAPLLFLDVDGPLLPFGGGTARGRWDAEDEARFDGISPLLGERLAALPGRLVWATAWEDDANVELAPRLGLPILPVVHWPEPSAARQRVDDWFGLHWKTQTLVERAAGHPFVWVDDELTDSDRRWVAGNHRAPALLHHVDPVRGLAEADFAALHAWLLRCRDTALTDAGPHPAA